MSIYMSNKSCQYKTSNEQQSLKGLYNIVYILVTVDVKDMMGLEIFKVMSKPGVAKRFKDNLLLPQCII